ncbi:holo-ACP synthase [Providencia sp. Je.9.19]|uniref:holo-ACP synthase n=1 Tax=Providencia sp. Je.9.19 TaxID=3142844 RepID=UPI003DA8C0B1
MISIGTDIIEINRVIVAIERSKDSLIKRLFRDYEISYIEDAYENPQRVAGLWAAKEAAVKAVGIGFRLGITFHDIEIRHDEYGCPYYKFNGVMLEIMNKKNIQTSSLSISHCRSYAVATALLGGASLL